MASEVTTAVNPSGHRALFVAAFIFAPDSAKCLRPAGAKRPDSSKTSNHLAARKFLDQMPLYAPMRPSDVRVRSALVIAH